jgi:hypothetical protein
VIARKNVGGGEGTYCEGITWPILSSPSFTLDFDHTDDEKKSCGTNEEVGVFDNGTIVAPPYAMNQAGSSGGNALRIDSGEDIYFDNDGGYLVSTSGTISLLLLQTATPSNDDNKFDLVYDEFADQIRFFETNSDDLVVEIEGTNQGPVSVTGEDIGAHDGKWIQVQIRWDAGRCAAAPCTDGGEDEVCIRSRVDDNSDGEFAGGGAEDWVAWACDTDTDDYTTWTFEAGSNDIRFGQSFDASSSFFFLDDIEIESSATW